MYSRSLVRQGEIRCISKAHMANGCLEHHHACPTPCIIETVFLKVHAPLPGSLSKKGLGDGYLWSLILSTTSHSPSLSLARILMNTSDPFLSLAQKPPAPWRHSPSPATGQSATIPTCNDYPERKY